MSHPSSLSGEDWGIGEGLAQGGGGGGGGGRGGGGGGKDTHMSPCAGGAAGAGNDAKPAFESEGPVFVVEHSLNDEREGGRVRGNGQSTHVAGVPDEFVCPISLSIMVDPVIAAGPCPKP